MAPKWEKELYRAIRSRRFQDLARIAQVHPEAAPLISALDGLMCMNDGAETHALQALRYAWAAAVPVETHPFVRAYLSTSHVSINIAVGVSPTFPLSRDAVGLALVELEQHSGNLEAAITVAEHLEPSTFAAVSLCELYLQTGRNADVIDTTNQLTNQDDASALLLAFRGAAFREQGMLTAAREAFKEALRAKSRDASIRHFTLVERAKIYRAEGKNAMARKDLERVLAEDANHPGVRELMEEIVGNLPQAEPTFEVAGPPAGIPGEPSAARPDKSPTDWPATLKDSRNAPSASHDQTPGISYAAPSPEHSNITGRQPKPLPPLEGYGQRISFDGDRLLVAATNSMNAFALSGSAKMREVSVPHNRVWSVHYSPASPIINGKIDVRTIDGDRYQIHFRFGQRRQPWQELAEMLVPRSNS